MNKQIVYTIFLSTTVSLAQPPDTLWTKTYGGVNADEASSVQQTWDGGYILAGSTESFGAGGSDFYLIKAGAGGNVLWTKTYGGTAGDAAESAEQTFDAGYIIAGFSASFGAGNGDYYLIKTDASGDSIWARTYGGSDIDWGFSVDQTVDSGYIVAGISMSFGGAIDAYLVRTDESGMTIWDTTYGGILYDGAVSVQQTSDSGYIAAGVTSSFGAGMSDVYLIKTNAGGDTLWTKTFGGIYDDAALSVQQTLDDGYIIAGVTFTSWPGESDVYLVKTDSQGDLQWAKTYGGIGEDAANSVTQTLDGSYIIAGYTASFGAGGYDVWLMKTNTNGDTLWTKTYGGVNDDAASSVRQTADGGYIIAGYTASFGAGGSDVWLIKTEPDVGIEENGSSISDDKGITATIFHGPLQLPEGEKCKVYDITGRVVEPETIQPGVYFIEVEGSVVQKVIMIR